jgi:hypothetical protein
MTLQNESAGGYDTNTADTKTATETIAPDVCNGEASARPADMLASNSPGGEMPPLIDTEKQFSTLQAQFAIHGHALHRTNSIAGPATHFAERWGQVRHLETLHDVEQFLARIGGRHG